MRPSRHLLARPLQLVLGWFEDSKFRILLRNSGWLLGGNAVVALLGLVGTAIRTRVLGIQQFGLLAVVVAYVGLLQELASFSSWQALIKYGAEALGEKRHDRFISFVKVSLLLDVTGALTGIAIAIGVAYLLASLRIWSPETTRLAAVFSFSILSMLSSTPTGMLRLLDRFDLITAKNVITNILTLAGTFVVYLAGGGIWGFMIVMLITSLLGSMGLLVLAWISLKGRGLSQHWRLPITEWKPFVRFSLWTYLESTAGAPVKNMGVLLVSAVVSVEAAGIYKIISQVCSLLGFVVDPISQAVYPQFATMIAQHDGTAAARYAVKIGWLFLALTGIPAAVLAVSSPYWLGAIFGQGFSAGAGPLSAFLAAVTLGLTLNPIHPLFAAFGYVKQSSVMVLLSNILYLILAWQLGLRMGLYGVAIAVALQYAALAIPKALYMRRNAFRFATVGA